MSITCNLFDTEYCSLETSKYNVQTNKLIRASCRWVSGRMDIGTGIWMRMRRKKLLNEKQTMSEE